MNRIIDHVSHDFYRLLSVENVAMISIKRKRGYFYPMIFCFQISPVGGVLFREPTRATRRPAIAIRRRMVPKMQIARHSGERAKQQRRDLRLEQIFELIRLRVCTEQTFAVFSPTLLNDDVLVMLSIALKMPLSIQESCSYENITSKRQMTY